MPDTFAGKALVDTLEQRLLFSAEHPLGLSLVGNDDVIEEMHHADVNFVSEALDVLRNQQLKDSSTDLPPNDDSDVDDELVVLHVTTTEDILDAEDRTSYKQIIEKPGADGAISLREAIDVANADPSVDIIRLDAETYRLTLTEGDRFEDENQEGDLDLSAPANSQYIIQGVSQDDTIIKQTVPRERFAEHVEGRVIITDLTIQGGNVDNAGGGLLSQGDANTVIENVLFVDNEASIGGGAIDAQGTMVLNQVTLSGNGSDTGGGISIRGDATVTIIDSTISNNLSKGLGGGVSVRDTADLTILNSSVTGNFADNGAGISIEEQGTAVINDTLLKTNHATNNGGGVYNLNKLTIADSKIIDNTAKEKGAGLYNDGGATVERTLIWGNNGFDSTESEGGGIYNNQSAVLEIRYSFIGNNESNEGGAGIQSSGSVDILSTTIAGNRSESFSGAGGLLFEGSITNNANILDSVLANNTAGSSDLDMRRSGAIEVISSGFNLVEHQLGVMNTGTDIFGLDPLFDAMVLADDQLLLDINSSSPIINAGSSAGVGDTTMAGTLVDATPNMGGITSDIEGGLVFWATASGDIYRSSPSFSFNQRIITGAGAIKDIEVSSALGRVYWLDESTDEIKSAKLDGSDIQNEVNVSGEAIGIAIDADDQRVYVALAGTSNTINQYELSAAPADRVAELIDSSSGNPTDIEYDDEGNTLYWSNGGVNASIEFIEREPTNPENWESSRQLLSDNRVFQNPYALAIDEINNVAYVSEAGTTTVSSYDSGRSPVEADASIDTAGQLQAVTYDALNAQVLVGDNEAKVYSVDASLNVTRIDTLPESMLRSAFLGAAADEQVVSSLSPVEVNNSGLSFDEGGTATLNASSLRYSDGDSRGEQISYTHNLLGVTDPNIDELTITVDARPTDTFTQAHIDSGRVNIIHNGEHAGAESAWTISVVFDVNDHNSGSSMSSEFLVEINNVNDAPEFTQSSPVSVPIGTSVPVSTDNFFATDEESDDTSVMYTVPDLPQGVFQLDGFDTHSFTSDDLIAERITFSHDGTGSTGNFDNSISVSDGDESIEATFVLEVTAAPVAPTTGSSASFTVSEGGDTDLNNEELQIEDSDTQPADVNISVVQAVEGEVMLNNAVVTEFTLENLINNQISFRHNGAEKSSPVSLELTVNDGTHQINVPIIDFEVLADNDNDPIAADHSLSGKRGSSFDSVDPVDASGSATNTLLHGATDEDFPDDSLQVSSFTQPSRGMVSVEPNGEFVYTVNSGEALDQTFQDSFTYQIKDGANRESLSATVLIDVIGLERPTYNNTLTDITTNELDDFDHTLDADAFSSSENATPFIWSVIRADGRPFPDWLMIDRRSGNLSGTPDINDMGSFDLLVSVFDTNDLESTRVPITLTVNNVNQAPTIDSVSTLPVDENASGEVVGSVFASDPDSGDTLIYSADDARFEFDDNRLKLLDDQALDFEAEEAVILTVSVEDNEGLEASKEITIFVSDVNEPPSLQITNQKAVPENTPGAVVADVTVSDPDAGDLPTVTVSDTRFEVVGDQLRLKSDQALNFETEPQVFLTLLVEDSNGGEASQEITVAVSDVNERPSLQITNQVAIPENSLGAVVADVTASDPDAGDSPIVTVSDNRFEVVGDQLRLKADQIIDFEDEPQVTLSLSVQADSESQVTRDIDVQVLDVNELPVQQFAVPDQQIETDSVLTALFNSFIDPEGDELTYTLTLSNGDELPKWLVFDQAAGELRMGDIPRNEVSANLRLIADDGDGGVMQLEFTLTFLPVPELGSARPIGVQVPEFVPIVIDNEDVSGVEEPEVARVDESDEDIASDSEFVVTAEAFSGIGLPEAFDSGSMSVSRTNAISDFLSAQSVNQKDGTERDNLIRDVFDDSTSLADLFSAVGRLESGTFSAYAENFEKQREVFESDLAASKGIVVSSITLSSGLSVGYILYLLRGGAIMSSMLTSLPAWRFVDPLPIVGHMDGALNSDGESLESLVTDSRYSER